jgi:electron transfer flavoprotein alpha subunit
LNGKYTHIVAAHSTHFKNVLPRTCALLDVSPIVDVLEIVSQDSFKRSIYAGNAIATMKSHDKIKVITIRTTAFPAVEVGSGTVKIEEYKNSDESKALTVQLSEEVIKSDRPELTSAKVVISGGRGMKNGENFEMLYKLADKFGGAAGNKLINFKSWCVSCSSRCRFRPQRPPNWSNR